MNFTGTVLADAAVPLGGNATHYDVFGQGGLRAVATIAERNAITSGETLDQDGLGAGLRKIGMFVFVVEDDTLYKLQAANFLTLNESSKLAQLANNANWVPFTSGGPVSGGEAILYAVTGQNVDGALTQKAATDLHNFLIEEIVAVDAKVDNLTLRVSDVETALEGKVDEVAGYGLSQEDFTTTLRTKLEGLGMGGDTDIFFDGNRPITRQVPGLEGVTPGGADLVEMLENLFYPAVAPLAALSAANQSREYGESNAVTLSYAATRRTRAITGITVDGNVLNPSVLNGTLNTSTLPNTSRTFNMSVTDGILTTGATASVNYYHNRFWFQSPVNLLTYSANDLSAVLRNVPTKEFATARNQDRSFTLSDEYVYFAYPATFGDASFIVGGLPNTAYLPYAFTYTNANGYQTAYVLYRSGGKGAGAISILVR